MDSSIIKSSSAMEWIYKVNPYLAFRLLSTPLKTCHFPKIKIDIKDESEVVVFDGVMRVFESLDPFFKRGGKVVFVEKEISKVGPFLEFIEPSHFDHISIILDEEMQHKEIAKKFCFKKIQFIGKLLKFKESFDQVYLSLSEYSDFGKTILQNIQANLLFSNEVENGACYKGCFEEKPVVICGSGPSLLDSYEKLKELEGKVLIFAAGSTILTLLKWNIKIDAAFFVDPWPEIELYEKAGDLTFPLFYQNRMSRDLFLLHKGKKIWMGFSEGWEIEKWIYKEIGLESFVFDAGWNVGCFALHCATFFGCKPISLIGMDGGEKRDLKQGVKWMTDFKEKEIQTSCKPLPKIDIDKEKLVAVIEKLNDKTLYFRLDQFIERLKTGVDQKSFYREKILLEVDLEGNPLYEFLIHPLFELFKEYYPDENGEKAICFALFGKRVLAFQQKFRFYPSGNVYSIETDNGLSTLFYSSGEIKGKVFFSKGVLDGVFVLYAKNGVLLRKGEYKNGKKEGVHIVYGEDGKERLIAQFKDDVPIEKTLRKNEKGVHIEELFYHNPNQFDRRVYSDVGELKKEGVFQGDEYIENEFDKGVLVLSRKGKWKEGELVWD